MKELWPLCKAMLKQSLDQNLCIPTLLVLLGGTGTVPVIWTKVKGKPDANDVIVTATGVHSETLVFNSVGAAMLAKILVFRTGKQMDPVQVGGALTRPDMRRFCQMATACSDRCLTLCQGLKTTTKPCVLELKKRSSSYHGPHKIQTRLRKAHRCRRVHRKKQDGQRLHMGQ